MKPRKNHRGRCKLIKDIRRVMPHIKESDMEELAEQVLGKLQSMTDEEFHKFLVTFHTFASVSVWLTCEK